MPLSKVQKGFIGESEVTKFLMMSSDGDLEVDLPATDDDRRDREVHKKGQFGVSVALQVKITMVLKTHKRQKNLLHIRFHVERERLVNHPLFWYVVAYVDPDTMTCPDPLYLIDSKTFHKLAWKNAVGNKVYLDFEANMSPESTDLWTPSKVSRHDFGKRVLQIIHDAEKRQMGIELPRELREAPGLVWVGARRLRAGHIPRAAA